MAIWYILWPFGNLVAIWHIFPRFGMLCREKSGSPAPNINNCQAQQGHVSLSESMAVFQNKWLGSRFILPGRTEGKIGTCASTMRSDLRWVVRFTRKSTFANYCDLGEGMPLYPYVCR
jgi:hypothetical protein